MPRPPRLSLRLKLLLASVAVQLAVMALLMGTMLSHLHSELRQQGELRIAQFAALADSLLAAALSQQDPTVLQQTLDRLRRADTISYLVLLDPRGQVLAASGWNLGRALPPVDVGLRALDFDRADTTLHAQTDLVQAGQRVGSLRYGFSTEFMHAAQHDLLWRTLPLAASLLLLTAALLAGLGRWLTRQLSRLETASARLSAGDYAARAEILGDDDIGRLAQGFNTMAAATQQRLLDLQASEALQRRHRDEAQDEHARLQALVEAMDSGILFVDAEERVFYVNGAFLRIWRLPLALVPPGRPLSEVGAMLRTQMDDAGGRRQVLCPLPAGQASDRVELTTLDDRQVLQRQQRVSGAPGGMVGRLVIHDDVSAERRVQRRAARADRDMLTDLLNRRGLQDALTAAVAEGGLRGTPLVLFFIDLDDFKYTNDTFGHRVGDQLLRDVAGALAAELRPGEAVARIGGDEFAVLCPGLDAAAGAQRAPRLVQAVARLPVDARGHELRVGCSVGLAVFPDDAPSADSLMVCADLAMYDAKRLGKNGWAAYRHDAERTLSESAHLRWSARLTRAIDEQRFCLQFQAVHHAASPGGVAHYEALLRLPSEDAGGALVAPGEFVPYAERSGRIRPIDRWVMGECVRALAAAPAGVRVAANLSARSIDDRSLPDHLQALLAQHAVDPRRLLIEITETSTIGDPRAAGEMIGRLRALGCSVHLDDFGAGFASFAHLKLLAVDGIKIDGSYVRGLARHDDNRAFVSAMVAVARALGMTTVAEHVEDEDTLVTLRLMGVDLVQGFLLDRPRTLDLATLDA